MGLVTQNFIILAISVDRFYAICRPMEFLAAKKRFWWMTIACLVSGTALTWPSALVYGPSSGVTEVCGHVVTVYMCGVSDKFRVQIYPFIHLVVSAAIVVAIFVALVVLYSLVAHTGTGILREFAEFRGILLKFAQI